MSLPRNLVTGKTAKLPGVPRGMDKLPPVKQQKSSRKRERSDKSAEFGRLWAVLFPLREQPVPQYKFALPERKWVADWAFVKSRVLVEIDGGQWVNGGHNRGSGRIKDMERDNWCVLHGWRVLRYTPQQIKSGPLRWLGEVEASVLAGRSGA